MLQGQALLKWACDNAVEQVCGTASGGVNPHLAKYVHLLNLRSLFEFTIPSIQDYGCTLKGNDWDAFFRAFTRLTLFYLSCSTGASEYCRSMVIFHAVVTKWFSLRLPVSDLLR